MSVSGNKKKKIVLTLLLGIVCFIIYLNRPDPEWTREYPATKGKTCTIFLIDGLSSEIFKEELEAGHLPTLAKLISKSMYTENGNSSFPTMTGYGFFPFITGAEATESGILGLRWFDRNRSDGNLRNYVGRTNIHMNEDLSDSIKNFFELSGNAYTASINTYMNRGVKHPIMTGWAHTTAKYEGKSLFKWLRLIPFYGEDIAKDHFEHESEVLQMSLRQLRKNPKVHWVTFPSPDAYNHVFGTDVKYHQLIRHIDSLIGVYVNEVKSIGQESDRMIAVVSDHGISDVHENIDFCKWMEEHTGLHIERGKSVHVLSSALDEPIESLSKKDGYFVINGNLTAYLYMKNNTFVAKEQWKYPLPAPMLKNYPAGNKMINIPELLTQMDGLELIIYKENPEEMVILNGQEKAIVKRIDHRLSYHVIEGNPLNYPDSLRRIPLTSYQWLQRTTETDFPNAIPRIWQLMSAKGIGDIVMTSRKGVDLANDYEIFVGNYKGGHGGLRKEIITVPYILYRPGHVPGKMNAMNSAEVGRMIKEFLCF
ncbi:MAG: alkaline phosphatase family protein [Saprospiraceae bacterium]|nr:alkaline phosphatase family protein [Saprospiraceae bacterium]